MASELERSSVRAVMAAILPGGAGLPGAAELELFDAFARMAASLPALRAAALRAAFVACALGLPLVALGRPRTLMSLEQLEQQECLSRLLGHRLYLARQLGLLLKAMTCVVYMQHDRVRAALELPPVTDAGGWEERLRE